jgi:hypothetical protein
MSSGSLSYFGVRLREFLNREPVTTRERLVRESKAAGYEIEDNELRWTMLGDRRHRADCNLDLVRGPADILGLSTEEN